MSLPGTEAVRIVQRGARKAKSAADLVSAEAAGLQSRLLEAVERRGAAVSQLAQHYLPALDEGTVGNVFRELRAELEALQARRLARIEELRRGIAKADAEQAGLDAELAKLNAELEALVVERTDVETKLAERLAADAEFQDLSRGVADAETRLELDEARAAELEREAKDKLPAYENSRLFRYLDERRYGTPDYTSRDFVRRMDRLVADVIDWPRTKAGWDFLRSAPELVAAEVERRRMEFTVRMAALQKHERLAAEQLGLPPIEARGDALGERRDTLLARIETSNAGERALREELARAESANGEHHAEAIKRLRTFLDEAGSGTLTAHAQNTADPIDDRLVAGLDAATRELDGLREQLARLGQAKSAAEARASGLTRVVDELRRAECDSVRCQFEELSSSAFERRIDELVAGAETPEQLLADLMKRRRFDWAASRSMTAGPLDAPSARSPGSDVPWWVLSALGAVAEVALQGAVRGAVKGALGRGISRSGSWGGSRGGGGGGGTRSGGGGGGGLGSRGGGFTRGSGF